MREKYNLKAKVEFNRFSLRSRQIKGINETYKNLYICRTDNNIKLNHSPDNTIKLVVDATEGFIPLWMEDQVLKWRFDINSMQYFQNPQQAMDFFEEVLNLGLQLWGFSVPIKFVKDKKNSDFEIRMISVDDCNQNGCVLASAFFPDGGKHKLDIYPAIFELTDDEIIETMAHELGHIFGLRHYFALLDEKEWPAEIYGEHSKFSIMNYGENSQITDLDRNDLHNLYQQVWSGKLKEINGIPIRLFHPYTRSLNFGNEPGL